MIDFKNLGLNFLKGILAGLSIGLGGFLYIILSHYVPGEGGKALGSLFFGVGLFLVCTFGFSLYTGKIGLIYEEKKDLTFYLSLPVMLIGNAIGAIALGYLCYFIFKDTDVMNTVNAAVTSRITLSSFDNYLSLMIKSFLCGLCVYLAVKLFALNRLKPIGIIGLLTFVFIFVYCGFQHCIANMFYFGFGNTFVGETFINLALCILFNSFGPVLGVLFFRIIEQKYKKE